MPCSRVNAMTNDHKTRRGAESGYGRRVQLARYEKAKKRSKSEYAPWNIGKMIPQSLPPSRSSLFCLIVHFCVPSYQGMHGKTVNPEGTPSLLLHSW